MGIPGAVDKKRRVCIICAMRALEKLQRALEASNRQSCYFIPGVCQQVKETTDEGEKKVTVRTELRGGAARFYFGVFARITE